MPALRAVVVLSLFGAAMSQYKPFYAGSGWSYPGPLPQFTTDEGLDNRVGQVSTSTLTPEEEVASHVSAWPADKQPFWFVNRDKIQEHIGQQQPGQPQTSQSGQAQTPQSGQTQPPLPGETRTSLPAETRTPLPGEIQTPLPGETRTPLPGETRTSLPGEIRTPLPGESRTLQSGQAETQRQPQRRTFSQAASSRQ